MIRRVALVIQYDGSDFCGWQKQKDHITIQSVLEEKIADLDTKFLKIRNDMEKMETKKNIYNDGVSKDPRIERRHIR